MTDRIVIRLPAIYANDALSRDLEIGDVIRANARFVYLAADQDEIDEIRSDAGHYADPDSGMFYAVPDVARSARAALVAVDRAVETAEPAPAEFAARQVEAPAPVEAPARRRYLVAYDRRGTTYYMADVRGSTYTQDPEQAVDWYGADLASKKADRERDELPRGIAATVRVVEL